MTSHAEFFSDTGPCNDIVSMADRSRTAATGKGTLQLVVKNAQDDFVFVDLKGALLVPALQSNLLAIVPMTKECHKLEVHADGVTLTTPIGEEIGLNGTRTTWTLRTYNAKVDKISREYAYRVEQRALAGKVTEHHSGHELLGHPGPRATKKTLEGVLSEDELKGAEDFCEICEENKITMVPIPKDTEKTARKPGDLIVCDMYGKIKGASGSYHYIAAFYDKASSYYTAYPIRKKDDLASVTQRFIREVPLPLQGHSDDPRKRTIFQTDNDSVYRAGFSDIMKKYGYNQRFSPPYTPQENGAPTSRQDGHFNANGEPEGTSMAFDSRSSGLTTERDQAREIWLHESLRVGDWLRVQFQQLAPIRIQGDCKDTGAAATRKVFVARLARNVSDIRYRKSKSHRVESENEAHLQDHMR